MKSYGNLSGNSGVVAYEGRAASIVVQFKNGKKYKYTTQSAGDAAITTMKSLALAGKGLSTFIAQHRPQFVQESD